MNPIRIDTASFSYDPQTPVLKNIDLTVNGQDFIGLIGPNGSGKSTLLRLINKTLKTIKNTVFINSDDIESLDHKTLARIIGTIGQDTSAPFSFTVEQMVMMGRSPYLSRWSRETVVDFEIVKEAMDMTEVTYLSGRLISELSGGERQRVMIAQALAQQPQILLMDEPTTHLDIRHQLSLLGLVSKLNQEGLTIIAVFHDLNQAARYCNKLTLIKEGSIVASGPTKQVMTEDNIMCAYGVKPHIHAEANRPYLTVDFYNGVHDG